MILPSRKTATPAPAIPALLPNSTVHKPFIFVLDSTRGRPRSPQCYGLGFHRKPFTPVTSTRTRRVRPGPANVPELGYTMYIYRRGRFYGDQHGSHPGGRKGEGQSRKDVGRDGVDGIRCRPHVADARCRRKGPAV